MREKHRNSDSLSKKTEFYERQEQREANRPEIKEGFSFMDKETSSHEMARQVRPTDTRSPRITKRASREKNLEKDPRDADRDNAQVKNCERDTQGEGL